MSVQVRVHALMFRGSLPSDLQAIIHEHARDWPADAPVYVGCSGNLTIERTLVDVIGERELHSNDVQLYSCAIGWALAGQDFRLEVADDYRDRFDWLEESMTSPAGKASCVLLGSTMLTGLDKFGGHYERMRTGYRDQWETMHTRTVAKFGALGTPLASFTAGDVRDFYRAAPQESVAVCFPPFFAGDYEKQFESLHTVFDWDRPVYPELDQAGVDDLIDIITSKRDWLIGLHVERPQLARYLKGRVRTTNRGVTIHIYGTGSKRRVVTPRQEIEAPLCPHLRATDDLTGDLALAELTVPQFQALRSMYMNPHIKPGSGAYAWAVLDAGRICGVFAVSSDDLQPNKKRGLAEPTAYLLSDFPVAGSKYDRLAKLVLYAAVSYEASRVINRARHRRIRSLTTTAFSKRPVSAKYRGLFTLMSREDMAAKAKPGDDPYTSQGFMLNYGSLLPRWTLAEGFAEWQTKHGTK